MACDRDAMRGNDGREFPWTRLALDLGNVARADARHRVLQAPRKDENARPVVHEEDGPFGIPHHDPRRELHRMSGCRLLAGQRLDGRRRCQQPALALDRLDHAHRLDVRGGRHRNARRKAMYPIGGHDDPAKANVRADQGSPVGCVRTANFGQELHAVGRERELQPAIGHGRRLDVRVEEDAPASKPGRECLGSVHDHGIGQTIVFRVEHHGVDQRRSRRRIEVSLERDPPACRDVQTGRTGVHRDRPFAVCQESDPALAVVVRDDACDTDGV